MRWGGRRSRLRDYCCVRGESCGSFWKSFS